MMPQTLNETQVAVEVLRHTTSLSTAKHKKENPQRQVSCRQPVSVKFKRLRENIFDEQALEEQSADQGGAEKAHKERSASS